MAVDDVAVGTLQAELLQNALAHRRVVIQRVVGVFGLGVGGRVGDEPALEGGHAIPAEDGGVAPCPQPPQKVHPLLPLRGGGLAVVGPAGHPVGVVQKRLAAQAVAALADGELHERTVLLHGDAAVEEQVPVVDAVQAALGVEETDVALELLAVPEGPGEGVDEGVLLRGEGVGVGGVHGGKVGVQHGIAHPADGHGFGLVVDLVQQKPVVHAEGGVAADLLPLQLEQDHGDGLVHPGAQ